MARQAEQGNLEKVLSNMAAVIIYGYNQLSIIFCFGMSEHINPVVLAEWTSRRRDMRSTNL
jgi:hypothetical protein